MSVGRIRITIRTLRTISSISADLGFTELSMEPVVSGKNEPYALTEEDLPVLLEQYEKLAAEMLRRRREGVGAQLLPF